MYRKSVRSKRLESKRKRCAQMRSAKERRRRARLVSMIPCGEILTSGCFGSHVIRLAAFPDDSGRVAVNVDGAERRPRTLRGVRVVLAQMIFKSMTSLEADYVKKSGKHQD